MLQKLILYLKIKILKCFAYVVCFFEADLNQLFNMKQDGFYILHVIYEKRLFVPLYSVTATSKDSELYNLKC